MKKEEQLFKHWIQQRQVVIDETITPYSIQKAIQELSFLQSKSSKAILLQFNSYGGYVDAGLALYDYIKASKISICTQVTGVAASMAAVLLAAGKKGQRSSTKNSRIMIHQPSGMTGGKASDIQIHAKEIEKLYKKLGQLLSHDTGNTYNKVMKDLDKDLWLSAEEAKEYGIIDRVV